MWHRTGPAPQGPPGTGSPHQLPPHGDTYFPAWIPSQVDDSFIRIRSLLIPASLYTFHDNTWAAPHLPPKLAIGATHPGPQGNAGVYCRPALPSSPADFLLLCLQEQTRIARAMSSRKRPAEGLSPHTLLSSL